MFYLILIIRSIYNPEGNNMRIHAIVLILFILALSIGCATASGVQMGSYMDVTYVNVVTDTSLRSFPASADVPAEASYSIQAKGVLVQTPTGFVLQPATGSITAFMNVHTPDLVYSETTTASGYIDNFVKNMYYQDGAFRI